MKESYTNDIFQEAGLTDISNISSGLEQKNKNAAPTDMKNLLQSVKLQENFIHDIINAQNHIK